ncbi:MAG: HD-GYP domain-containing protein [Microthrixaceae bacterium]|nr:HD-GYP domain-containing protein [Microthrixaceae bacterium]
MAARLLRIAAFLVPLSAGAAASIAASLALPDADTVIGTVARTLLVVAVATVAVRFADKVARRFLPLAALMQLSLVFPDQAPARFRSALRAGSSRRLERAVQEARTNGLAADPGDAARQVVELIGAIGDHDRRTRGHSERVRLYADLLGEEMKLSTEERQKLQWGALLHDLGKLMVPDEILNKAGKPSDEEWAVLKGHPDAGMDLIAPLRPFLGEWVAAIGGHHEKWNGSGYPKGLVGSQIPRAAAIVAVADSYEVMTATRSYKKPMSISDARAELTRCAGAHFSPEVVRAFLGISLGRLRVVAGPLSALAHLPFLGAIGQVPAVGAVATTPAMASAFAVPAVAMATTAALVVGAASASADDLVVHAASAEVQSDAATRAAGETAAPSEQNTGGAGSGWWALGEILSGVAPVAAAPVTSIPPQSLAPVESTIPTAPAPTAAPAPTPTVAATAPAPAPKAAPTTAAPTTAAPAAPVPAAPGDGSGQSGGGRRGDRGSEGWGGHGNGHGNGNGNGNWNGNGGNRHNGNGNGNGNGYGGNGHNGHNGYGGNGYGG